MSDNKGASGSGPNIWTTNPESERIVEGILRDRGDRAARRALQRQLRVDIDLINRACEEFPQIPRFVGPAENFKRERSLSVEDELDSPKNPDSPLSPEVDFRASVRTKPVRRKITYNPQEFDNASEDEETMAAATPAALTLPGLPYFDGTACSGATEFLNRFSGFATHHK